MEHLRRDGDPDDFDASRLRRDRDGSGITIGLGKSGPRLTLRGEHLGVMTILLVLVFYLLGAFAKFGVESPIRTTNGSAAEHKEILEEMAVTHYILSECLRGKDTCPRLSPPRRLEGKLLR